MPFVQTKNPASEEAGFRVGQAFRFSDQWQTVRRTITKRPR